MGYGIRVPVCNQIGFEELFCRLLTMKTNGVKRNFLRISIVVSIQQIIFCFHYPLFAGFDFF